MTGPRARAAAGPQEVADALRAARAPLLLAHTGPDGDALGSALAVALALDHLGVRAAVSFGDDPFVVPGSLAWMPGLDLLVPPAEVGAPDLVAAFDSGSPSRLGVLEGLAAAAAQLLVVDHHTSYTGYGTLALVDTAAEATAVLVLGVVDALGVPLDPDIATCLYTGLLTDTGSFRYAATTAATHAVAGRLLDCGVRPDEVARRVYEDVPLGALRLLGAALDRAELDPGAAGGLGLVSTMVGAAERAGLGLPLDAAERIIDVLRSCVEAEVVMVCKQDDAGDWRVSLRSKGRVDVGAVASALGGGGHRYAAGFTDGADPDALRAAVRAALDGG